MKTNLVMVFAVMSAAAFCQDLNGRWEPTNSGSSLPANAVLGGRDWDDKPEAVCRARYQGSVHLGKRIARGTCNIAVGQNEIPTDNYDVLVGNNSEALWNAPNLAGATSLIAGNNANGNLRVCRAAKRGNTTGVQEGIQLGEEVGGECHFGWRGNMRSTNQYQVLYSALAPSYNPPPYNPPPYNPAPPPQQGAPNIASKHSTYPVTEDQCRSSSRQVAEAAGYQPTGGGGTGVIFVRDVTRAEILCIKGTNATTVVLVVARAGQGAVEAREELWRGIQQIMSGSGPQAQLSGAYKSHAPGQPLPANAIFGGHTADGGPLAVCQALHEGNTILGWSLGQNCHIVYQGNGFTKSDFDVLVGNNDQRLWGPPNDQGTPWPGGAESGQMVRVCRGDLRPADLEGRSAGVLIGKEWQGQCLVEYGTRSYPLTNYQTLYMSR